MKNKLLDLNIIEDASLYNTYKLDSKAKYLVNINNTDELINLIKVLKEENVKYFVLGASSNVILPKYYDGVVIKLSGFDKCTIEDNKVYVEANYMINKLAMETAKNGYSGLEWASGIPGSIGGCIYNNAGAYKGEIIDVIKDITVLDQETYEVKTLQKEEANFEYRDSIFKHNKNLIILSTNLELTESNKDELLEIIKDRTEKRMASQPLDMPSCGSVFRNPEGLVAGKLIDDLGLKGYKIGGAQISEKHANFIVNAGNATYEDIVSLIEFIKDKVKENYNIDLILEQEIIK